MSSTASPGYPALAGGHTTKVAVVGGGIAGITTALLLKRAGVQVAILEADSVGSGVTGHTTGKLTAGQGLAYSRIEDEHGADTAHRYADSQLAALELIFDLAGELRVDCELERVADYVYAQTAEEVELLEAELEASRNAGLPRILERGKNQPVPTAVAALRLSHQGQFHARKYVLGLAQAVDGDGSRVFEHTRVLDIESGDGWQLTTDAGEVRAEHVVLATNAPITSRGLFFARAHAWRSYAVAAPVPRHVLPDTWITAGAPTRSLRTTPYGRDGRLLVIVGEGHRAGQSDDTRRPYQALEAFLRTNFPGTEARYRWSTQDQFPVDGLPYIGRVGAPDSRLYVATGFSGWGLTNASVGALVIRDAIIGRESAWETLFDPNRSALARAPGALVRENANVARQLVGGRIRDRSGDPIEIESGSGSVLEIGGEKAAIHRDGGGNLHAVSPVCTHMGCLVGWNEAERTWDCPCHGSRFDIDGTVLAGPATQPLAAVDLPVEAFA
jgi:glycine/D-amino acid oxidase-like deaminating enzyme/nitrite reductase/ring-hydroxylating ferredoxin subunit